MRGQEQSLNSEHSTIPALCEKGRQQRELRAMAAGNRCYTIRGHGVKRRLWLALYVGLGEACDSRI